MRGSDEFVNEFVEGAAGHVEHAFEIVARAINGLRTIGFFGGAKIIRYIYMERNPFA